MNYTPTSSETWERGEGVGGGGDRTRGGGGDFPEVTRSTSACQSKNLTTGASNRPPLGRLDWLTVLVPMHAIQPIIHDESGRRKV